MKRLSAQPSDSYKVGVVRNRPMTLSLEVTPPAKKKKKRDRNPRKTIFSPGSLCVGKVTPSSQPVLLYLQELGVNWGIKKRLEEKIVFLVFLAFRTIPIFK